MVVFMSNLLTEVAAATVFNDSRTENTRHREFELAFATSRAKDARPEPPRGLVVSSEDEVSGRLAESLGRCGVTPLFASTAVESRIALAGRKVVVVLCSEFLADGAYEDVVNLAHRSQATIPLIVVSRTGEWPEYFEAVDRGAFDYVAYPPMTGDLERAIRNALVWNGQSRKVAGAI
ncbi:MAG TPA: hypothetical protein VHM93_26890 [Candidatus Acidoferrum sp.]|jgi:DNA-binding NtrC family response regulator|nr:hypothetical protein [Candidatus Acidoferrum sp.]